MVELEWQGLIKVILTQCIETIGLGIFDPLINLYIPLAGSWNDSSMKIVFKSHHWPDDAVKPTFQAGTSKTIKDGIAFSVPEIAKCDYELIPHCPDIIPGDFHGFSPVLVHGAGSNDSESTRFF